MGHGGKEENRRRKWIRMESTRVTKKPDTTEEIFNSMMMKTPKQKKIEAEVTTEKELKTSNQRKKKHGIKGAVYRGP